MVEFNFIIGYRSENIILKGLELVSRLDFININNESVRSVVLAMYVIDGNLNTVTLILF